MNYPRASSQLPAHLPLHHDMDPMTTTQINPVAPTQQPQYFVEEVDDDGGDDDEVEEHPLGGLDRHCLDDEPRQVPAQTPEHASWDIPGDSKPLLPWLQIKKQ